MTFTVRFLFILLVYCGLASPSFAFASSLISTSPTSRDSTCADLLTLPHVAQLADEIATGYLALEGEPSDGRLGEIGAFAFREELNSKVEELNQLTAGQADQLISRALDRHRSGRNKEAPESANTTQKQIVEERELIYRPFQTMLAGLSAPDGIADVFFTNDNARAVVKYLGKEHVDVLDINTGGVVDKFVCLEGANIRRVDFSANGRFLAINCIVGPRGGARQGDTLKVFDMVTRELVADAERFDIGTSAIAISPTGKFLAVSTTMRGNIRIYDVSQKRFIREIASPKREFHDTIDELYFVDDRYLVTNRGPQGIEIWDVENERLIETFERLPTLITTGLIGREQRTMIVTRAESDGNLTHGIWDFEKSEFKPLDISRDVDLHKSEISRVVHLKSGTYSVITFPKGNATHLDDLQFAHFYLVENVTGKIVNTGVLPMGRLTTIGSTHQFVVSSRHFEGVFDPFSGQTYQVFSNEHSQDRHSALRYYSSNDGNTIFRYLPKFKFDILRRIDLPPQNPSTSP